MEEMQILTPCPYKPERYQTVAPKRVTLLCELGVQNLLVLKQKSQMLHHKIEKLVN